MGNKSFSSQKLHEKSPAGRIMLFLWLAGCLTWFVGPAYSFAEALSVSASPTSNPSVEAKLLISIGDQYKEIDKHAREIRGYWHSGAIKKYWEALTIDPLNVEAIHRLVFSFRPSRKYDVPQWLQGRFGDKFFTPFLRLTYQLQALAPKYKDDPALLWKQVHAIEKSRIPGKYAGAVLEKLQTLNPDDPTVLAKLGEFRVEFSSSQQEKEQGISLIKKAIARGRQKPKFYQYLGEALVKLGNDAEAVRVYAGATKTIKGDDKDTLYEKRKLAVNGMRIFRTHAEKDKKFGVLAPSLQMSLEERVNLFEHFYNMMDPEFYPYQKAMIPGERYLLTLYSNTNNIPKAEKMLAKYYGGEGIGKRGSARFIEEELTKEWVEILEQKSPDSKVLKTLRATYQERWGKKAPQKKERN